MPSFLFTAIIFVVVLGVLIFVHELGHFLVARFYGVRVLTFSLGFGPKILAFRRGDTEYCISAVPLGGYVKMFGEAETNALAAQLLEVSSEAELEQFLGKLARSVGRGLKSAGRFVGKNVLPVLGPALKQIDAILANAAPFGMVPQGENLVATVAAFAIIAMSTRWSSPMSMLSYAFDTARALPDAKPRVILCDTLMGKGVPFLETREKNHFIRVDPPEWQQALEILDANCPAGA